MPASRRCSPRKMKADATSSDDEVVYVGTSPSSRQRHLRPQQQDFVDVGSSSEDDTNRRSKTSLKSPSQTNKINKQSCIQTTPDKSSQFIKALISMLNNPSHSRLITWTVPSINESQANGGGIAHRGKIVVHNPDRLQEKALGNYFPTSSFDKFQRRLSQYGFVKRQHYSLEGKLRACSYVHEELGSDVESLLNLASEKNKQEEMSSGKEESSPSLIPLARERRLNKRKRERQYDEVEEVVMMRKDPPPEAMLKEAKAGKVQSKGLVRKDTMEEPGKDDADLLSNNLKNVPPKINMPLEILDQDFIWSAAKIIQISDINSKQNCRVTVRYEGWGAEWDEELSYPNPRLARIYTYTKRVKCLAAILSKKKDVGASNTRNWTDIWPCTVSFRAPHPGPREGGSGDDKKLSPEELLRLENNVFVQPCAPHLLSPFLQKSLMRGGWWVTTSKLRPWKDFDAMNPISNKSGGCVLREGSTEGSLSQQLEYHFSKGFIDAYKIAKADKWIRGCLPPKATPEGSLVDEKYRAQNVGGDAIEGIKYTGAFPKKSCESLNSNSSPAPPSSVLPSGLESQFLQSPILVSYEHPGVRRLPKSNRWTSVVKMAGNDVFLGSFASQTEALRAREIALAKCSGNVSDSTNDSPCGELAQLSTRALITQEQAATGPINDLLNTPVEAVISSFEESQTKTPSFRLQDWVAENDKHFPPELQSLMSSMNTHPRRNKRKQSTPRQRRIINN